MPAESTPTGRPAAQPAARGLPEPVRGSVFAADPAAEDPAELIARAVAAHPSVARLDGGHFGEVATPLPGRRVVGVRIDEHGGLGGQGGTVEVAVVLWLTAPIPALVGQLRELVREVAGAVSVNVQVTDVLTAADADIAEHRSGAESR